MTHNEINEAMAKDDAAYEKPPKAGSFWLDHIRNNGVRLTVEIDLTFNEFRRLLQLWHHGSLGPTDAEVLQYWEIVNRRILPPDPGSFAGIGSDVNDLVKEAIRAKSVEVH